MRRSAVLFQAAQQFFGVAHEHSVSNVKTSMSWNVMDNFRNHMITIGHVDGSSRMDFQWEARYFSEDVTVSVNYNTFSSDWPGKINLFIENVKKPWENWSEAELLENPMWIYFYWVANGSLSESLQTAMTLSSYQNPDNEYVKRYFRECQK